jgi:hypothetical protein
MKRLLAVVSVFLLLAPTALGATWTNATWSADAENVILAKLHATEQQFCGFTRTETSQLETLARFKTADMVYRAYASHTAPDGWGTDDGMRNAGISTGGAMAEDLGWNTYPDDTSAAHIWEAWKASPGHWSAIVNCAYRQLGVGAMKHGTNHLYAIEFVKGVAPSPTPTPTSTPTAAPSATPTPTPAPTATPAPSSTPAPTVAPTTYAAIFTGDATGATDVTSALRTFLEGHAGQTVALAVNGTYKVSQLSVTVRDLTLDFRGSTIRGSTPGAHGIFRLQTASGVTLNGPRVTGTGYGWDASLQNEHGIQVDGGSAITINGPLVRNTRGDGIYVGYQAGKNSPPTGVRIVSPDIERASRNGISPVAGEVTISGGHSAHSGLHGIDFECNDVTGCQSVRGIVSGTDIRTFGELGIESSTYAVAAGGYSTATKPYVRVDRITGDRLRVTLRNSADCRLTNSVSDVATTADFPGCAAVTFSGNSRITRV